ncbi:MAG: zinc ABC transporter substrate-binding protein [Gammaproteobacteria bacterium]|jgi:zinc transport system substrate-binding protein
MSSAHAEVSLVVSIKPLQLIAASILGDEGTVRVLVPVSDSPHHYTMTPSDRVALDSADLVVYVGEQLETELHEVLNKLAEDQRVLELILLPGLTRRQVTGSDSLDPHIWLDSRNGLQIAAALRDALTEIDGRRARQWADNYTALEQRLLADEARWRGRLQTVPDTAYGVYHDAIGYFEARFERRHSVVLVEDPETQPGIRQMLQVRRLIDEQQPVCLFTDITSRQTTIDTLFAGHTVQQVQLDLLGDRLGAGGSYSQLLDNLVSDFSRCLNGEMD